MAARYTIGIDIGGTNIEGGVCDEQGVLRRQRAIKTEVEHGFEHTFQRMVRLVDDLLQDAGLTKTDVLAIGVGAPGPLSHERGVIYTAPNLPGWRDIPLQAKLSEATGLPVTLENDANAAAFGEFTAGAARDVRDMVMLTLGTGIGGGIVLNGLLWRGRFDSAAEIGHMVIVPGGRACPCGQRGCLERYGSANAVIERLIEAVQAGESCALASRLAAGEKLDARDVLRAAADGDRRAARIWDETCYYLALAAVNMQHVLNPELVVLAGGLAKAGERLLTPVRAHFEEQRWKIAPDTPEIVLATCGTDAGMIGAAALARAAQAGR
ncbi:MAG: ROK family protein [Planctomycetes bacterium]|nr:ROK family protein [Planctomycetota bacterium]